MPRGRLLANDPPDWASLRLTDRMRRELQVLFVGINPGVRSAITGHHFAGYSNRFWKLLWESRLVPEPITFVDDRRLLEFGFGITNLIARPSPGIDDLKPAEYVAGWHILERKIRRYKPRVVALVGVTLYRAIQPLLANDADRTPRPRRVPLMTGLRPETIHGARIYVLPNPSGRNANFTYAEMLRAFRGLRRSLAESAEDLAQRRRGSLAETQRVSRGDAEGLSQRRRGRRETPVRSGPLRRSE